MPVLPTIPFSVEVFGDPAELYDQIAGEVLGLDFASLFPPQPQQGGFVVAHDDAGLRAAEKRAPPTKILSRRSKRLASSLSTPTVGSRRAASKAQQIEFGRQTSLI